MIRTTLKNTAATSIMSRSKLLCGLALIFGLSMAVPANAQRFGGPTGLTTPVKKGVTLYQANGLTGLIYLKKVPQINPQGEYTGDKLEYMSTMNTQMKWLVRFDLPPGNEFRGLSVAAHSQGATVTAATADSWNGTTMIDTVSVVPWSLNGILQQCEQQLKKPDGTYKQSAVFNLQPGISERVRAAGYHAAPGAPSSNTQSATATTNPTTRVTVYVLDVRAGQKPRRSGFSQQLNPKVKSMMPTKRPTTVPRRPTNAQPPRVKPISGKATFKTRFGR